MSLTIKNCPRIVLGQQLCKRGYVKFKLKNYKGAIKDCSEALKLEDPEPFLLTPYKPTTCKLFLIRASSKFKLKNYKGAIEDFSKVIELDADDHTSLTLRGDAKLKIKDYKGAILDLNKGIELIDSKYKNKKYVYESNIYDALNKPEYELAYFNKGESKFKLKDFQSAIEDFSKVIELNPKNANVYISRGEAKLSSKKNISSAIKDFAIGAELDPKYADEFLSKSQLFF